MHLNAPSPEFSPLSASDRNRVMERLRAAAEFHCRLVRHVVAVPSLIQELAPINGFGVWLLIHELARIGVLIPGEIPYLQLHANQLAGGYSSNSQQFNWPFFIITPFGKTYLDEVVAGSDPGNMVEFIGRVRTIMPSIPDIVIAYVSEGCAAFSKDLPLASAVLLGVASEALFIHLYSVMGRHLIEPTKGSYLASLQQKKSTAEGQYHVFINELRRHSTELGDELMLRIKNLLEPLAKLMKTNRDDVAHQRATRIDRDAAFAQIASFPTILSVANDIVVALKKRCAGHTT